MFGGCPKRQVTPRIVYIPATPSAAKQPQSKSTQALVIEAPPPPEPVQQTLLPLPAAPEEETHSSHHRVRRTAPPASTEQPAEATPMPALEPSESRAEANAQRGRVQGLQKQLQNRIDKLSHSGLSGTDRRTLGGARAFLAQSIRALQNSDLQLALNLAHKAELLVQAVEGSQ